jgi:hypothetical protein
MRPRRKNDEVAFLQIRNIDDLCCGVAENHAAPKLRQACYFGNRGL